MKSFKEYKKKNFSRFLRVSQELKKEISIIFQKFLKDPRINFMITISMVKLSHDLSSAKVFFTYLDNFNYYNKYFNNIYNSEDILKILNKASGYIRKILCKKINLRIVPILHFYYDDSLLSGKKISDLINNTLKITK